jgi:hypothetical protein
MYESKLSVREFSGWAPVFVARKNMEMNVGSLHRCMSIEHGVGAEFCSSAFCWFIGLLVGWLLYRGWQSHINRILKCIARGKRA